MVAGLAVRLLPLGLPDFVVKYGGSMLWAAMIYWIVSTLFPAWRWLNAVFASGVLATAVEFFKLYRSPGIDAFRLTLPGKLLLGRYFSLSDIAAYWGAIVLAALIDNKIRNARRPDA